MDAAPSPNVKPSEVPSLRAAYSDRTASLMAHLSGLAYDFPPAGSDPGPVENIPSQFSDLGFEAITYFHTQAHNGWAYIVESPDLIAIVFRGTQSDQDWRTDLHVRMVKPLNTDKNLWLHIGFSEAFDSLNDGIKGIRQAVDHIKSVTKGEKPIYLTGHSLGGALAQIGAAVLGCDQIAACYTFGSPRVGNKYFDLWVKPPSYRVVNYADIVPQVPWFGFPSPPQLYVHSGDIRYLPRTSDGSVYRYRPNVFIRTYQIVIGIIQLIKARKILCIEDHGISHYQQKLAAIAAARSQQK